MGSSLIGTDLPFRVILPDNHRGAPVLFLLHGLFGSCDNWLELTSVAAYAADKNIAIVMPDGGESWYSDSATDASYKFEQAFIGEFLPHVENRYGIGGSREKRSVAGLSMGGYGALKFGLRYPQLFSFAASMSGAFNAPRLTPKDSTGVFADLLPSVLAAFGDESNAARRDSDLLEMIENATRQAVPGLYLDCGVDDVFLDANREVAARLEARKFDFKYIELPGGHDWDYWDRRLKVILSLCDDHFRRVDSNF